MVWAWFLTIKMDLEETIGWESLRYVRTARATGCLARIVLRDISPGCYVAALCIHCGTLEFRWHVKYFSPARWDRVEPSYTEQVLETSTMDQKGKGWKAQYYATLRLVIKTLLKISHGAVVGFRGVGWWLWIWDIRQILACATHICLLWPKCLGSRP